MRRLISALVPALTLVSIALMDHGRAGNPDARAVGLDSATYERGGLAIEVFRLAPGHETLTVTVPRISRGIEIAGTAGSNGAPSFVNPPTNPVTVAENASGVGTFPATDPDDDALSYSLSGDDAFRFGIGSDGEVTVVAGNPFDYETPGDRALTVTVEVSDGKSPSGAVNTSVDASVIVTITVTDVPPPVPPAAPTVVPTAVGGTAALSVSWVPPAENGSSVSYDVRWRAKTGSNSESFTADNVTIGPGPVATITGLASSTPHKVRVRVNSPEGRSGWSEAGEGRTNNIPPTFPGSEGETVTVAENTAIVGTTFTATDPDDPTLSYSLSGADATLFGINSDGTLSVRSGRLLDYEALGNPTLTLTVNVSDGRSLTGNTDTSVDTHRGVVIVVTDVLPPTRLAAPMVTAAAVGGTATLLVSWLPPEGNDSSISYDVRWRAKGRDSRGTFTSDNVTIGPGPTATISGLVSSTPHKVRVRINSAEGNSDWSRAGEGRTDNAPPVFLINAALTVTVSSSATTVGTFVAIDPDDPMLAYSLSGADASVFGVGPGGQVTVLSGRSLEHGTPGTPAPTITLHVSDGRSLSGDEDLSVDASLEVAVVVTTASRPAVPATPTVTPAAVGGTTTLSVSWTAPADNGSPVTSYAVQWRVKTVGGNGTYTEGGVSIGSGTAATITGLMSSTPHEVRVRAENAVGVSDWSTLGEGRTDNAPPTFQGNVTQTVTAAENSATVGAFPATDPDDATLTYSLSGEGTSRFGIDSGGEITVVADNPLDYETPSDRASTVTAMVSDGRSLSGVADPSVDASVIVVIKVTDIPIPVAPEAPTVTAPPIGGSANLVVQWNTPTDNGAVITAYAVQWRVKTDGSGVFTEDNVWTIEGRTAATITGLSSSTTYEVRIRGDSAEGNSGWSELGEGRTGNQSPAFPPSTPVTLAEGSVTVGTFTAVDRDNPTLTYTLSGADASRFRISTEGEVTVAGDPLDYETIADRFLVIVVEASDGLSPSGGPDTAVDTRVSVVIVVTDIPPPDEPEILAVMAPDRKRATTLTATWTTPEDNGSLITNYVVQRRVKTSDSNGTFTSDDVTASGTTAVIISLVSSTPYEVRIRADSGEGSSAWSELGKGLTNPNLDMNRNGEVDEDDALIVFYATGHRDTLEADLDRAVLSFSGRGRVINRAVAREILAATQRMEEASPSPLDFNDDLVFNVDDALIILHSFQFTTLLREHNALGRLVFGELSVDTSEESWNSNAFVTRVLETAGNYAGD